MANKKFQQKNEIMEFSFDDENHLPGQLLAMKLHSTYCIYSVNIAPLQSATIKMYTNIQRSNPYAQVSYNMQT